MTTELSQVRQLLSALPSLEIVAWFAFVFTVKVLDNLLSTTKTILIQKNRGLLAAISTTVSQVIFYKLIAAVSTADDGTLLYVISVAGGVGTILAVRLSNRMSKDRLYVNVVLSDDKDAMVDLVGYLRENRITNLVTDSYTKEWERTMAVTIYAETKEQSRLLDAFLTGSPAKFKRVRQ